MRAHKGLGRSQARNLRLSKEALRNQDKKLSPKKLRDANAHQHGHMFAGAWGVVPDKKYTKKYEPIGRFYWPPPPPPVYRPYHFGAKITMQVSVIYEDETENEFDVAICCVDCARTQYGLNDESYQRLLSRVQDSEAVKLPAHIQDAKALVEFLVTHNN